MLTAISKAVYQSYAKLERIIMLNSEKAELKRIIERIPNWEIDRKYIAEIHRAYAPEFSYATFKNYWRAIKGDVKHVSE